MSAQMNLFGYGWTSPIAALVMSIVGCMVGLLLAVMARTRRGLDRLRLVSYAALAFGGVGVWQSHEIAVLGSAAGRTDIRFSLLWTVGCLAGTVLLIGAGLYVSGPVPADARAACGVGQTARWLASWLLVVAGVLVTEYGAVASVRVGGIVTLTPRHHAVAFLLAFIVASATAWLVETVHRVTELVRWALVIACAATVLGCAALASVRIHLTGDLIAAGGMAPTVLAVPVVVLGGATIAMISYFTVGHATARDLRGFVALTDARPADIEPWLVEEVLRRATVVPAHP